MAKKKVKVAKVSTNNKIDVDTHITIECFMDLHPLVSAAQRYFYVGNNKTNDLRTKGDWEAITGLK